MFLKTTLSCYIKSVKINDVFSFVAGKLQKHNYLPMYLTIWIFGWTIVASSIEEAVPLFCQITKIVWPELFEFSSSLIWNFWFKNNPILFAPFLDVKPNRLTFCHSVHHTTVGEICCRVKPNSLIHLQTSECWCLERKWHGGFHPVLLTSNRLPSTTLQFSYNNLMPRSHLVAINQLYSHVH